MRVDKYSYKTLIYKYGIDIWGDFILRKKYRYIITKKMLLNFEFCLRKKLVASIRSINPRKPRKRRKKKNLARKFSFSLIKKPQRPQSPKQVTLRKLFTKILFKYHLLYKQSSSSTNRLHALWKKSHLLRIKLKIPTILYKLNKNFYSVIDRNLRPKKRNIPRYTRFKKLELIQYKHFFCFNSLQRFKNFIRKTEYTRFRSNIFFGMESNLLLLLFRTNLFPNTRYIYNFIRLGGVLVNGQLCLNPRKNLKVYDHFSVQNSFIDLVFSYFLFRLRRQSLLVNIPTYLDYDYKLMSFYIWRKPTIVEQRFISYFPFLRTADLDLKLKHFSKRKFIAPKE